VLNWFFGVPVRVRASSHSTRPFLDCADHSGALIDYPGGVTVLVAGGTHVGRSWPDQLTLYLGAERLDYQELLGPSPPRDFRTRLGRWLMGQPCRGRTLPDGMALQLADFVAAIRSHGQPRVTLRDGLLALRVADGISRLREDDYWE
ncbi:MAG: hypothetical protein HQM02_12760, partial [Magnetococcales bacterium]|nr:hypothetical protein [Magnetococcales bacterium]